MKILLQKLFCLIALIAVIVLAMNTSHAIASPLQNKLAQQQDPELECKPFDLLFLIDQSDTMGGVSGNDPFAQRIEAVRWVIRNLGFQSLFVCKNNIVNRIGVIPFGAEIDSKKLPLVTVNPKDPQVWKDELKELINSIEPTNLYQTDFKLAFKEANRSFKVLTPEPDRKRAIIVITDGAACSKEMSDNNKCGSSEVVKEYMKELKEQILQDFDPKQYHLWVIGINHYDELPPLQQEFYNDVAISPWKDITSNYLAGSDYQQLGKGPNDIPIAFVSLLETLSGVGGKDIQCEPIPVNPYLEGVQLNFFRNKPDNPVEIVIRDNSGASATLSQGNVLSGASLKPDFQYFSDGLNESYGIHHPIPGIWEITMQNPIDCDELRAQFIPIRAKAIRIAPAGGLAQYPDKDEAGIEYDEADPSYLEYQVIDRFGAKLPTYNGAYPINATVSIFSPSHKPYTRGLKYNNASETWQSDKPLPSDEMGTYTYSLEGTTVAADGTTLLTIIPKENGFYEVSQAISRFSWKITSPQQALISPIRSGLGCHVNVNDVGVDVQMTDYRGKSEPGNAIEPQGILSQEPFFVLRVSYPGQADFEIPMIYKGNPVQPGLFSATISGDKMKQPGLYTVHVVRTGQIDSNWGERGIIRDVNDVIEITRTDSFFTSPSGCTVEKSSAAIILFILIILFLWAISGKPRGFLIFQSQDGNEVYRMSVTRFWRWTIISGAQLGPTQAFVPMTRIIIVRHGSAKSHDSKEPGTPAIELTVQGRSRVTNKKETYLESEVLYDGNQAILAENYTVKYSRWGL